jgi:hypothetical protein
MKMAVFWVTAPCSLVEGYRTFGGACCRHNQGDVVQAASIYKMLVNFY